MNYGQMSLFEIYEALPDNSKASIRGNINRYIISKGKEALIKRVDRGIYSVVEILSVKDNGDKKVISYQNTFFTDNGENELCVLHKDFEVPSESNIKVGCYQKEHTFVSYDDLQNHLESVKAIFYNGDAIELMKRIPDETFDFCITDPPYRTISGGAGGKNAPKGMLSKNDGILFLYKGKAKAINNCGSKRIHHFDNILGNKTHPTEKPLELIKFYMENSSNEGDFGFDPFAGSFSLAKAGLELNRRTLSAEIDRNYYYFHKKQILNYQK